jgi:hypothetical protein
MSFVRSQRALLIFMGVATPIALAVALGHGPVWILELLMAVVAGVAAFMTCVRLAIGVSTTSLRRALQAFAAMAALLSILHLAGLADGEPAMLRDFWPFLGLQLPLLAIAQLVNNARRAQFVAQHRATDVGDFARYLFVTFRLFDKLRHPTLSLGFIPGGKPGLDLARFLRWYPKLAPQVRRKFGIGIWRQFLDLFVITFRHGLDTQTYYMFELYRPEARARASGYLTRYEAKNGLYKVLTWQLPKNKRRINLGDKLGTYRICQEHNIATVPILIVAEDGKLEYRCQLPAGLERDLFIKPRQSKGSKDTEAIRYVDGKYITENGATLDREGLAALIAERSREQAMLVQPRIVNHPGLADLADEALMRIRTITCLDERGEPVMTHAVLSNLSKLEPKWGTSIEFGAAIDLDSGVLGMMTGDKADMWVTWSEDHPITHAKAFGRVVPCWNEVRSISLAAHHACRDRWLVGWDIAVGPEGALLLEGNSYPDVDFLQRSHKCAIGDSPLGPLLYSRLLDIEHRIAAGTLKGPKD